MPCIMYIRDLYFSILLFQVISLDCLLDFARCNGSRRAGHSSWKYEFWCYLFHCFDGSVINILSDAVLLCSCWNYDNTTCFYAAGLLKKKSMPHAGQYCLCSKLKKMKGEQLTFSSCFLSLPQPPPPNREALGQ